MTVAMNAMQRLLTTLGHQEPDRVPLFLLTNLQGAKELGLSIEAYFSQAENVIEGQVRLLKNTAPTLFMLFTMPPSKLRLGAAARFSSRTAHRYVVHQSSPARSRSIPCSRRTLRRRPDCSESSRPSVG